VLMVISRQIPNTVFCWSKYSDHDLGMNSVHEPIIRYQFSGLVIHSTLECIFGLSIYRQFLIVYSRCESTSNETAPNVLLESPVFLRFSLFYGTTMDFTHRIIVEKKKECKKNLQH